MRIHSVEAINLQTGEVQYFGFSRGKSTEKVITQRNGGVNRYLQFCFSEEISCDKDVVVTFSVGDDVYSVKRYHADDGTIKLTLKQRDEEGKFVVINMGGRAEEVLEDLLKDDKGNKAEGTYITLREVEDFDGNLLHFPEIELFTGIAESVGEETRQLRDQTKRADDNARMLMEQSKATVSMKDIEKINLELAKTEEKLAVVEAQLITAQSDKQSDEVIRSITNELNAAQQQYRLLLDNKAEMDSKRVQLKMHDDLGMLVPQVRNLQAIEQQKKEYEEKRFSLTSDLEWQENELQSINSQLEEKQKQSALVADKRSKMEIVNGELQTIAELYERNKTLNQLSVQLNEQLEKLNGEKLNYKNRLAEIEKAIGDIKQSIDNFALSDKSVGELLETVRIGVKLDEVNSQLEKLRSELVVKESQISERESKLVVQVKRFKSVAELDVTVAPIKAKETLLQVLDAKNSKLEVINTSLNTKITNLSRALEDYRYRLVQIEQSRTCLVSELERAQYRKQEEFKREVFLNSQKVYTDDPTAVFAIESNLNDEEVETLKLEIERRNIDRDVLMEKASVLEGKIEEIKRQAEINSAEMETMRKEKTNIINRYNEIISQNRSEAVFNYLKALETDSGTKYLLDVQQEAVRSEAELAELKRSAEVLRGKISTLQSRAKYLEETKRQLDETNSSVDTIVAGNDQIKEELSDYGQRMSANYEQYRAIASKIEQLDEKIARVQETIVETVKTVKVNEKQIAACTEKAQQLAGSNDLEQAVANFRYEVADVESERQMLAESKQALEKEVFRKRIELEKLQWLYENKSNEYAELRDKLQFEFNLKGMNIEDVDNITLSDDTEKVRKLIADYDALRSSLADRIENYYTILKAHPPKTADKNKIAELEQSKQMLTEQKQQLQQQAKQSMDAYMLQKNENLKLAVAATQAQTMKQLQGALRNTEIVGLLVNDKITALLRSAQRLVRRLTGTPYVLENVNGMLQITLNDNIAQYSDIPESHRNCVYVSLKLATRTSGNKEGWLLFDDRLKLEDKATIIARNFEYKDCVTEFKRNKA